MQDFSVESNHLNELVSGATIELHLLFSLLSNENPEQQSLHINMSVFQDIFANFHAYIVPAYDE